MEVTLKPDLQKLCRSNLLMVNYRPQKFRGVLAPTQYASVTRLSPAFRASLAPRDYISGVSWLTPAARITWWTSSGSLREFRTASDERTRPGNEATCNIHGRQNAECSGFTRAMTQAQLHTAGMADIPSAAFVFDEYLACQLEIEDLSDTKVILLL